MVGGAAGSVSKIFSGVGKGLAALTFDSDFQKQRRKQLKKRADQNFGEGMARNTRGLAMGIFEGVTGVATKPIQGAKQEGVGGFFKGNFLREIGAHTVQVNDYDIVVKFFHISHNLK